MWLASAAPVGHPKSCRSPIVLHTTECTSKIRIHSCKEGEEFSPADQKIFKTGHVRAAARPVPSHNDNQPWGSVSAPGACRVSFLTRAPPVAFYGVHQGGAVSALQLFGRLAVLETHTLRY